MATNYKDLLLLLASMQCFKRRYEDEEQRRWKLCCDRFIIIIIIMQEQRARTRGKISKILPAAAITMPDALPCTYNSSERDFMT